MIKIGARLENFARAVEENQSPTSLWVEIDRIRGQNETKILPAEREPCPDDPEQRGLWYCSHEIADSMASHACEQC